MRQRRSNLRAGGLRRGSPVGLLVGLLSARLSGALLSADELSSGSRALSDELEESEGSDESVDTGADGTLKTALAAVPTLALGAAAVVVVVVVAVVVFPAPPLDPNKKFLACSLPCVNVFVVYFSVPLALASLSLSDPPDLVCTDCGSGGDVESSRCCGDPIVASLKISLSRLKLRSVPVAAARVTSGGSSWPLNLSAGVKGTADAGRLLVVGGMRGGSAGDSCTGAGTVEAARLFLAAGDARGGRAGDCCAGAGWGCGLALVERLDRVTRRAGWACWACSSCGTGVADALALRVLEAGPAAAVASGPADGAFDGGPIPRFDLLSGEAFFSGEGGAETSCSDGGGRNSSLEPILKLSTLSLRLSTLSLG